MALWLKWEKGLERKHEILQIASRLMIPPCHAAGSLMVVMGWLDDAVKDYDESGNANVTLGALPLSFIDTLVGIAGFAEALSEVRWMTHKDGVLTFVNAGRHNGITAKKRALTRERVEAHRKKKLKRSCNAAGVTNSPLILSVLEGVQGGKKAAPAEVIPVPLDTPPFREAWVQWKDVRRAGSKPKTPWDTFFQEQLLWLERFPAADAIEIIKQSIRNGWQGLFELKTQRNGFGAAPKPAKRADIYTEPEGWRERAKEKWPEAELPELWSELSATARNDLLAK